MANSKISLLPSATPQEDDEFAFVRAGTTSRASLRDAVTAVAPGAVLQVVSTTKTDTFTTTATTATDVTGLSVSITPSSTSSKILVFYSVFLSTTVATAQVRMQLVRGSTAIAIGDTASNRTRATARFYGASNNAEGITVAGQYLDSPATTSATTYKVQVWGSGSTTCVNRTGNDTDSSEFPRVVSSITVMEIAG